MKEKDQLSMGVNYINLTIKKQSPGDVSNQVAEPHKALAQLFIDDFTEAKSGLTPNDPEGKYKMDLVYFQEPTSDQVIFSIYYGTDKVIKTVDSEGLDPDKYGIVHFGINSSDEKMKLIVFGWSTLSNGETREKICRLMIDAINTKLMKRGYCLDHNKEEINS